nr:uncharacterized protein LOC124814977 [Hydra vulgaris]
MSLFKPTCTHEENRRKVKGITHKSSLAVLKCNIIQKLANNVKTIEQIAYSLIKDKIDKKGKAILATGGKKIKKGAYPQNQYIQVSIYGGRGFLKVCLNIVSNPSETIKNKRRKYGEIKSPNFKEGSVKASFIIALVPDAPETNHNVKILLNKLCLDKINFTYVADIKLCQVKYGMSPSSMATNPCYICTCNKTEVFKNNCTELRTHGSIKFSRKLYKLSGSKKIRAKECFNCIDEVLLIGDDNDLVVNHLSPPELHLMNGATNHIFKTINKLADLVLLKKIENDLNISKSIRNGSYNGNSCQKILKNWVNYYNLFPVLLKPMAEAFRLLDNHVHLCFGVNL